MGGQILKLFLLIGTLNLVNTLPKNNFKEKIKLSKIYDTKIKQGNNERTILRHEESSVEAASNIALSEMDAEKQDQNESSAAEELSISDTLTSEDKSDPTQQKQSISDDIKDIQASLSKSDNSEEKQSSVDIDDGIKTSSEEISEGIDNVDDNTMNGEHPISDPDNHVDTQTVSEEVVETDDADGLEIDEEKLERPLLSGDTFTPSEMLPITTKLIAKVENPGSGRGFVSSSTNPRELADRLFEAFFLTNQRIVTLKDFDVSGLDALQALALSGEPAGLRNASYSIPKTPKSTKEFQSAPKGQYAGYGMASRQSHYRLITKKVNNGDMAVKGENKRRVIGLAKRLAKKRRLVLNSKRRLEHRSSTKKRSKPTRTKSKTTPKEITNMNITKKEDNIKVDGNKNKNNRKVSEQIKSKRNINTTTTTTKATCRWRYECADLADLDTCRLHTQCAKDENYNKKLMPDKYKEDEHSMTIRRFHKMLGITFVDEEVEKILENRITQLRSSNSDGIERIESLSQYFNKIIMTERLGSTTPSWV